MTRNLVCSECGGNMLRGYLLEEAGIPTNHIPIGASIWVDGMPEYSFWTGLKLKRKLKYYTAAYRCERCGFLKFYAGPDHSSDKKSE